jgi:glycosyltransferase involved in cell wall biosynthesis
VIDPTIETVKLDRDRITPSTPLLPRITVIIPSYREGERLLRAAISSLILQTERNWEGIVVDDAPDHSPCAEIVKSYCDARLTYVRNDGTHGIGNAWNLGLTLASRQFVSFLHSDDELDPVYLETMLRLADTHPEGSIYACDATVIDVNGKTIKPLADRVKKLVEPKAYVSRLAGRSALLRLGLGNFLFCPTLVYRRSALGERRFSVDYRFVLDLELILSILLDGGVIFLTKEKAYRYRRIAGAATQEYTQSGSRFDEEIELNRVVSRRANLRGDWLFALLCRVAPLLRLHICYRLLTDARSARWGRVSANLRRLLH